MSTFLRKIRIALFGSPSADGPGRSIPGSARRYLFYALGEIILVVIGILIALQVNNWNENRKSRNQEMLYLESFKIDLNKNLEELGRVIKKSNKTTHTVDTIFHLYQNDPDVLSQSIFDTLIWIATGFTVYNSQEATVNDILGSGKLEVIKDDSLRQAIGSWKSDLKIIREWEKLEKNSWKEYSDYNGKHLDFYNRKFNVPVLDAVRRNQLLEDRIFLNLLYERGRIPSILNNFYTREYERIQNLITKIDKELNQ